MSQKVKEIEIKKLVLWTENPRDPISSSAKDQDIVDKATEDRRGKWELKKLASRMGDLYDFSELPIVVYKNRKPVVYDGNRRMILAKIKHGFVKSDVVDKTKLPKIPSVLPCNVCDEETALNHINRKHGDSGSWSPLQQDIFQHKYLKSKKSNFLLLDEQTGIVSNNPHMDVGFVKKEIFNGDKLDELGFAFKNNQLKSRHSDAESKDILQDLADKVAAKKITTRVARGRVTDILETKNRRVIRNNSSQNLTKVKFSTTAKKIKRRKTKKSNKKRVDFFGEGLVLEFGEVNNLYRDIVDLNNYYQKNESKLSRTFPGIIRMSLRLLCETASKDKKFTKMDKWINKYFAKGKKGLDSNQKTLMTSQNVTEKSLIQLLQTGAHSYTPSSNYEQTLGMSLIIGQMLKLSHRKH